MTTPISGMTLGANTQGSNGVANEVRPASDQVASYTVADNDPRLLRIPRLGVEARVFPVAPGYNGEPVAAGNIFDVGWLSGTTRPGGNGASLINGHTSGLAKAGVFNKIGDLAVGDVLLVEQGNGRIVTFKVVRSQLYDAAKVDVAAATKPVIAGRPGLNLLTNTGRFNVRTNQFEQRIIVFAAQE
ncbi:MAG TPA: class F sortase [Hymenobacter sp.]